MPSSGMLRCVALVKTEVSEETNVSNIRVTKIGELETTLAVTSNRNMLHVKFEVFTAVTMKNAVFLDVTSCGSYKSYTTSQPRRRHCSIYM
jgi:hypothetical protein